MKRNLYLYLVYFTKDCDCEYAVNHWYLIQLKRFFSCCKELIIIHEIPSSFGFEQRSLLCCRNFVLVLIFSRRATSHQTELFEKGVHSYLCHVTKLNTVWKKSTFCKHLCLVGDLINLDLASSV